MKDDLFDKLKKRAEAQTVLKEHGLNKALFRSVALLGSEGYTNKEIAEKLGIHAQTIKRYSNEYKKLTEGELSKLKPLFQKSTKD